MEEFEQKLEQHIYFLCNDLIETLFKNELIEKFENGYEEVGDELEP